MNGTSQKLRNIHMWMTLSHAGEQLNGLTPAQLVVARRCLTVDASVEADQITGDQARESHRGCHWLFHSHWSDGLFEKPLRRKAPRFSRRDWLFQHEAPTILLQLAAGRGERQFDAASAPLPCERRAGSDQRERRACQSREAHRPAPIHSEWQ
jgi:hypothetical protein